jgi:hypothetical protein
VAADRADASACWVRQAEQHERRGKGQDGGDGLHGGGTVGVDEPTGNEHLTDHDGRDEGGGGEQQSRTHVG